MSISVHCEPCGKTYQLRDDMAGRKGKCPRGHTIYVPEYEESPSEIVNDFAFTDESSNAEQPEPASIKRAGKRSAARKPERAAAATPVPDDEFSFPATGPVVERKADVEPKSGRYRGERRTSAKEKSAGRSMIPMLVGGVVAILGIGGGFAMFFTARAEVNPLREQAEAATKKAEQAEAAQKMAEAGQAAAEARLPELQKTLASRESALKSAQDKATSADKKFREQKEELEKLVAAKSATGDGAARTDKKDAAGAAMPAKLPGAAATGGKNWTAPASFLFGMTPHNAGDRFLISPKEDVPLKAEDGLLHIKFRYKLQKGKEMPANIVAAIFIMQAGSVDGKGMQIKLTEPNGDSEVVIPVKGYTGSGTIIFALTDGNFDAGTRNLKFYSTLISMPVEFDKTKD